jgi:hypothetical protein
VDSNSARVSSNLRGGGALAPTTPFPPPLAEANVLYDGSPSPKPSPDFNGILVRRNFSQRKQKNSRLSGTTYRSPLRSLFFVQLSFTKFQTLTRSRGIHEDCQIGSFLAFKIALHVQDSRRSECPCSNRAFDIPLDTDFKRQA